MSHTDTADIMGMTSKALDAYKIIMKVKKIRDYGKLVKAAVDDNTRSGALLKLGIKSLIDIAGKVIGTSLTTHPYYTIHKAHLEALAQALNASSNFDSAEAALNRAIRSADASASLAKALGEYEFRKNGLKLVYMMLIAGSLKLLADTSPNADKQLRDANQTRESLRAKIDQDIYEWRASFCDVYVDCVQLLAMAEVELQTTRAAMKRFDEKIKALKSGGVIGRIFAHQADENRQWQEFDRLTQQSAGDAKAVEDPSGYVQDQIDDIEKISDALAQGCEAAMSEDAYRPEVLLIRIGTL